MSGSRRARVRSRPPGSRIDGFVIEQRRALSRQRLVSLLKEQESVEGTHPCSLVAEKFNSAISTARHDTPTPVAHFPGRQRKALILFCCTRLYKLLTFVRLEGVRKYELKG